MFRQLLIWITLVEAVKVNCLDLFLLRQSVLYGLSSLAEVDISNSSVCLQQLNLLFRGIESKHVWALKVLDASGQPSSGFLSGNNLWLGSHSQCSELFNKKPLEINNFKVIQHESTPYDYPPYPMNFVMAYMKHNNTLQQHTQMPLENLIELGLCVPQSCKQDDLILLLQKYLDGRYWNVQNFYQMNVEISEVKILKEDYSWLKFPKTIITLTVLLITTVLVIIGTTYDVRVVQPLHKKKQILYRIDKNLNTEGLKTKEFNFEIGLIGRIVNCFSLYTNTKNLVKTKVASEAVGSIHGLRVFGMLWIMAVHSIFFQIDYLENVPDGFRLSEGFTLQIFGNSSYCVDSFLYLSGFLVSYMFYTSKKGSIKTKKPINYSMKLFEYLFMAFNRFLRLTPVYMMTIAVADTIFSYYRQSSVLYSSERPELTCSKYWWRNLLYINNLFPRSEMCLSWSWYLSADTQFFLITTFLLILSTIKFKTAVAMVIAIIIACVGITGYRSYTIGYIPTMDEQLMQLDAIYDLPWNRMGPYLIGVITGYILVIQLKGKLVLKKRTLAIMWTIFPLINLWILFTLYGRQVSVEFSAVYMALSRTLWGFGMGWLIIACCTNNAGVINKFLSFRGWVPLSRLTYCCYLLNPIVTSMVYLGAETAQRASLGTFVLAIFGMSFMTFFYSFWFSLFFESPYILLTKILVRAIKTKSETQSDNPA